MSRFLIAATLLLVTADSADVVSVPPGPAPLIDGQIAEGEWDGAVRVTDGDGTGILLQHDGTDLYVALQAGAEVLGSLCLLRRNEVLVLHASQALGVAVYERAGQDWRLVRGFEYAMREADFSPETARKRSAWFAANGWLANTTRMGDVHVREFRISGDMLDGGRVRLMAAFLVGQHERTGTWPTMAADACGELELVRGHTPESLAFRPDAWPVLELMPAAGRGS
jgi:hypothetical protein